MLSSSRRVLHLAQSTPLLSPCHMRCARPLPTHTRISPASLSFAPYRGFAENKKSQKQKMRDIKKAKQSRKEKDQRAQVNVGDNEPEAKIPQFFDAMLKFMTTREEYVEDRTPEEIQRAKLLEKEYSRQKMYEHRRWQKMMSDRIRVRWEAINSLPPKQREAALQIDLREMPVSLRPALETPPIPGYVPPQEAL